MILLPTMLHLRAPAKINWYLRVLNKREDGYHNIESIMQKIALFDEIYFDKNNSFSLLMESAVNIELTKNIIYKTALKLKDTSNINCGAHIKVLKKIPIGAGLGGGSSDSAYTILGLNQLWGINLPKERLFDIALEMGSDVPFFLSHSLLKVEGKGEIVTEISDCQVYNLVIVKPELSISTAWAYALLKRPKSLSCQSNISEFLKALLSRDYKGMNSYGVNDFELPIFEHYPELLGLKKELINSGSKYTLMSGSGSSIFGVFETRKDAEEVAQFLSNKYPNSFIAVVDTICGREC